MAKITLTVMADTQKAEGQIKTFRSNVDNAFKNPVTLKVEASGLDAAAQKMKELSTAEAKIIEAAAKLASAEARKINAQTKAAEAAKKLEEAQRKQTAAVEKAAESTQRASLSVEELSRKYLESAKDNSYLEDKMTELYRAMLQQTEGATASTRALVLFADSTSLVVQNATTTENAVRRLAQAYLELAAAAQGGAGYTMPSSAANYISAAGSLQRAGNTGWTFPNAPESNAGPYSNVSWQRYLPYDYVPNWTWGGRSAGVDYANAVDVDYTPVTEGANAAAAAASRASSSFNTFRDSMSAAWSRMKEGTAIADALGDSIGNIVVKITTWQVVNGIVASVKRTFQDALETMKAVDDELVTVRKVTGFTVDEMKRVEEQAYKTASAYGVSADAYLESVSAFARAGYKEQSAALAELSTKTQIVGDTTAETANQFLLSVDAAYQYKGSVEELTKVLDGANELDNKYATSIEKIAEGMGIVAPVAKQVNVGVDELAAAIGTITAVTQRSGSEAARALRALFLNIVGDTKTEIDEGVTWTTGEIAGLQDVIKLYAKDAYDAAQATGEVLNPMEAIAGLARSMEDGVLTAAKLTEMVSDIGGKLRTSQLLAIIQNWDMYTSMVEDFNGAVGSADKEVANAMDSWTRKTNRLSNAFTEFISHIVDSNGIKAGIDLLTGFVRVLDSGVGEVAALSAAFLAFGKVASGIVMSRTVQEIQNLNAGMAIVPQTALGAAHAVEGLGNKFKSFTSVLLQNPAVVATAVAAIVYGLKELDDALTTTTDEYADRVRDQIKNYEDATNELESLSQKVKENNALIAEANQLGKDDGYITRLSEENGRLQEQIQLEKEKRAIALAEAGQAAVGLASGRFNMFDSNETLAFLSKLGPVAPPTLDLAQYFKLLQGWAESSLPLAEAARKELSDLTDDILEARDGLIKIRDAYGELTPQQQDALDLFDELIGAYVESIDTGAELADQNEDVADSFSKEATAVETAAEAFERYSTEIDNVQSALKVLSEAQEEYNANGALSVDTVQALLALDAEYLDALIDENGQINLNSDAISTLIEGKNVLLERLAAEAVATYAAEEADRLLAEQEGKTGSAAVTAAGQLETASEKALGLGENAVKGAAGVMALTTALERLGKEKGLKKDYVGELISNVTSYAENIRTVLGGTYTNFSGWSPSTSSQSRASSGGSGTSGGAAKDEYLEDLKDAVALEKQRLSFLEGSGAAREEQVEQIQKVQEALHKQADYLRSIGASEKDVLALSTEWWSYQSKIEKLAEDTAKAAAEAAKTLREEAAAELERIGELLDKQAEAITSPLQAELDALKEAHEIREDDTEEAEKLLAVEKARIALENAQNERTVRVYNAATGQWEWQANAATVKSARETLAGAEKDLADFYENQRYAKAVAELENRIKGTNDAFKSLEDTLKDLASGVKTGSVSEADAYTALRGSINELGLGGSLLDVMKANSAAWHGADAERQKELAAENLAIGTALGLHIGKNGVWYDAEGNEAYGSGAGLALAGSALAGGDILKSADWENHLRRLGIVTAGGGAVSGYAGGVSTTSIGSQHNGNVYQLGGVTLTEQQARGLTVYDLMTLSGALALGG